MFGLRPPFVHFVVIFGSPAQCRAEVNLVALIPSIAMAIYLIIVGLIGLNAIHHFIR
jgi:hypothetical protein